MNFIRSQEGFLNPDECHNIISHYLNNDFDRAKQDNDSLYGTVLEVTLDENDDFWDKLLKKILPKSKELITDYLKFNHHLNFDNYIFSCINFMHHQEFFNIVYHYDGEALRDDEKIRVRNFAFLIYLNDNFSGGELVFPVQNQIVCPKAGMGLIFPTSFMFPHGTNPSIGSDRYVLRLNYFLKEEY